MSTTDWTTSGSWQASCSMSGTRTTTACTGVIASSAISSGRRGSRTEPPRTRGTTVVVGTSDFRWRSSGCRASCDAADLHLGDALWCHARSVAGRLQPARLQEPLHPPALTVVRLQELKHPSVVGAR